MSRYRRWSSLFAMVAITLFWAICTKPWEAPNGASPKDVLPGRSDRDESTFFDTNESRVGAEPVPERIAAPDTTIAASESTDMLRFALTGATPAECRGETSLFAHTSMLTLPVTGPEIVVPTPSEWRRIEIAIPGFVIATQNGPFAARPEAIGIPLLRAGTIVVDVRDTDGNALAGRLVYCFTYDTGDRQIERSRYITTPWATTDDTGRAESKHVLPGNCSVAVQPVAEWLEAETKPVEVREGAVAHCSVTVPVLAPDEFGGFTFPAADCPFLVTRPEDSYRFVTGDGRDFRLWPVGKTFRCIVPGKLGEVFHGRVQWREGRELHRPSWESAPITVTIGAVPAIATTWTEVPPK